MQLMDRAACFVVRGAEKQTGLRALCGLCGLNFGFSK
jgi:hypothetical protein